MTQGRISLIKYSLVLVIIAALLSPGALYAAQESTLTADNLNYNTNTKKISAKGNVVIKHDGATLTGDVADGNTDKEEFELTGNVKGSFPKEKIEITSAEMIKWSRGTDPKSDGVAEATGHVRMTKGAGDYLNADYVRWEMGTENYLARGNVDGLMEGKLMKAQESGRTGDKFWGREVARFEDTVKKMSISAKTVDGAMDKQSVSEAVAKENVVMEYFDKEGLKTVVTGKTAVYSRARGTAVVSGGAKAVRSDGKTITADSLVVHEDSRIVEGIGNSRITVIMQDKNKKTGK